MKKIKILNYKIIIPIFIVFLVSYVGLTYASTSTIGGLFEKIGTRWYLVGTNIRPESITRDQLGTDSVITSKILNGNVTEEKLSTTILSTINSAIQTETDPGTMRLIGDQTIRGIKTFNSLTHPIIRMRGMSSLGTTNEARFVSAERAGLSTGIYDLAFLLDTGAARNFYMKTTGGRFILNTDNVNAEIIAASVRMTAPTPTANNHVAIKSYVDNMINTIPTPVYTYSWLTDGWSSCLSNTRFRNVTCIRNDGVKVSESRCTGTKPIMIENCGTIPTPPTYTYSWQTSAWSTCSASCGGGTQTRTVSCRRSDGVTVANSNCTGTAPSTSQACNTNVCPPVGGCQNPDGFVSGPNGEQYGYKIINGVRWTCDNMKHLPSTGNSWCYNNNLSNCNTYGRLYDWTAATHSSVCGALGTGWALPTDPQWTTLTNAGATGWTGNKLNGLVSTLPGRRNTNGSFGTLVSNGYWWSSTQNYSADAWSRYLLSGFSNVYRNYNDKHAGFSVLCINTNPITPTYTYSWQTSAWSTCSVSCGGGTQTRTVSCRRSDGVTVANSNCTGTAPATSQACNTNACPFSCGGPVSAGGYTYTTRVGIDGNCWTSTNMKHTPTSGNRYCYGNNNTNCNNYGALYNFAAANTLCSQLGSGWVLPTQGDWNGVNFFSPGWTGTKLGGIVSNLPGKRETNGSFNLLNSWGYRWTSSPDTITLSHIRYMINSSENLQTTNVSNNEGLSVICVNTSINPPTYTYSWQTSSWSTCSASCGGGTQTRTVSCRRSDGVTVANSNCTGTAPSTSQACNTNACISNNELCRLGIIHSIENLPSTYFYGAPGTINYTSNGCLLNSDQRVSLMCPPGIPDYPSWSTKYNVSTGLFNINGHVCNISEGHKNVERFGNSCDYYEFIEVSCSR